MVVEVATLHIRPDREDEFVAGFAAGAPILARQPGCLSLRWGRRVEPDLAYMLTVEWDAIEDHFRFRETKDFEVFGAKFREFLAKPPEVVHFEPRA